MKKIKTSLKLGAVLGLTLIASTGCETDGGGTSTHSTVYYGVGWYGDPYYHGDHDYDYEVTVPPPDRPGTGRPPHVEHPIARPPSGGISPRPSPMPSIPSMSRPSPRMGGGGGGKRR